MNTIDYLAKVFTMFHDGAITGYEQSKSDLSLRISCQYLAEIINPGFENFYLSLHDVNLIELETYTELEDNPATPHNLLRDINTIFEEEIDIFNARPFEKYVEVNCWQINDRLNYVGNKLRLNCTAYTLSNQDRSVISLTYLNKICTKYWKALNKS